MPLCPPSTVCPPRPREVPPAYGWRGRYYTSGAVPCGHGRYLPVARRGMWAVAHTSLCTRQAVHRPLWRQNCAAAERHKGYGSSDTSRVVGPLSNDGGDTCQQVLDVLHPLHRCGNFDYLCSRAHAVCEASLPRTLVRRLSSLRSRLPLRGRGFHSHGPLNSAICRCAMETVWHGLCRCRA